MNPDNLLPMAYSIKVCNFFPKTLFSFFAFQLGFIIWLLIGIEAIGRTEGGIRDDERDIDPS